MQVQVVKSILIVIISFVWSRRRIIMKQNERPFVFDCRLVLCQNSELCEYRQRRGETGVRWLIPRAIASDAKSAVLKHCDSDAEIRNAAPVSGLTDWCKAPGHRTRPVNTALKSQVNGSDNGGQEQAILFGDWSGPDGPDQSLFSPGIPEHFGAGLMTRWTRPPPAVLLSASQIGARYLTPISP